MTEIEIRNATRGDDRHLAALDRRSWAPGSAVSDRPSIGGPFFGPGHTPDQFLVADTADGIAGYIRLVPPTPLASNAHVRQIQGLAVDPGWRGRGIGRALLGAACELAARQGARRVTLRVLASNGPARRLYESAGFAVEGVLPGEFHIAGRYVDDIFMGRTVP
jgi:ribosomal protein S18 acetylase RimI-like enzyme